MTDLYSVVITNIKDRCVEISFDGLDSDSSHVGTTKSFYLMLIRERNYYSKKDDLLGQLIYWDDMLDEEWLYRNLNSFIQYVQLGLYEGSQLFICLLILATKSKEERPYWTCSAKYPLLPYFLIIFLEYGLLPKNTFNT